MSHKKSRMAPYRNQSLPPAQRVADLVGRLTLREKIALLTDDSPAVPRLGIGRFKWGGECLHGLCMLGAATQFPMPIGLAATFDPALLEKIADAVSDEARARHHDPAWRMPDGTPRVGLAFYTPVINIFRDPRWGRGQETYGEDPHLTSVMGSAFVRGLQGRHPRYLKVAACAKHLAAHSGPEKLRRGFNAVVSRKDLAETYLPAFEALTQAGVATVMATYNRVNGEHCCASPTLIGEFLRGKYGFQGMLTSDGGALASLHTSHKLTRDAVETAGLCLKHGCDMEIGRNAYPLAEKAIRRGLITEADIDRAVANILTVRFKVGEFDSPQANPYTRLKADVVQCPRHRRLAREAAAKSLVLLKNNGLLPLEASKKVILVTGPNAADAQVLLGNFYKGVSGDLRTILEGIVAAAPNGTLVTHGQGCFLTHPNVFASTWTFGLSKWADAVVVVLGYSPLMEGEQGECIGALEGGDKRNLDLPTNQLDFLREMKKESKKPIVAIVTGGSPLDLAEVHQLADAVLLAWYPGEEGGPAVGEVLFGKRSPSGKLPVTFPKSLAHVPAYENYALRGRTYRYATQAPLYPFGFGLSYTQFQYGKLKLSTKKVVRVEPLPLSGGGGVGVKAKQLSKMEAVTLPQPLPEREGSENASPSTGAGRVGVNPREIVAEVTVTNTGSCPADEVVQLYLTDDAASVPVPRWALKAFQRITLRPKASKKVRFRITAKMMEVINQAGDAVLEPGTFTVWIGGSSPDPRSQALGAPKPVSGSFRLV